MKVYALVGKSGTGKSYQAMNVCRTKNIVSIIDDGLLIYNNDVVAGISAKRQPTVVGAIKTALFSKDEHKADVVRKLKTIKPESTLIIGTSDAMPRLPTKNCNNEKKPSRRRRPESPLVGWCAI